MEACLLSEKHLTCVLPENLAKKYKVVDIGTEAGKLKVGVSGNENFMVMEDIRLAAGKEIVPVIMSEDEIQSQLENKYIGRKILDIINKVAASDKEEILEKLGTELADYVIELCISLHASDIHIEPFEEYFKIRYRQDGDMYLMSKVENKILDRVTSVLKVMAGLDSTEKRLPQDGTMTKRFNDTKYELRINFLPTIYGEKIVIRIIYPLRNDMSFQSLGFNEADTDTINNVINRPYGLVIVSGPTGSGKSTTLSSMLSKLNNGKRNIITVEDPVENKIEGINHVSTNAKTGLSFAVALKAILRQDPDVIMIGEIRDEETASIAVRAALTGHLVISTLHTNDAMSVFPRLIDMNVEPYLVASTLKGVISQRLIKKLCTKCKQKHIVTKQEAEFYGIDEGTTIYKPCGCSFCSGTGYKGRMVAYELFEITKSLENELSTSKFDYKVLSDYSSNIKSLQEDIKAKVIAGYTSLEELDKCMN